MRRHHLQRIHQLHHLETSSFAAAVGVHTWHRFARRWRLSCWDPAKKLRTRSCRSLRPLLRRRPGTPKNLDPSRGNFRLSPSLANHGTTYWDAKVTVRTHNRKTLLNTLEPKWLEPKWRSGDRGSPFAGAGTDCRGGQQDSSGSGESFNAEDHRGNCGGDSTGAPRANPVAHRGRIHRRSFSARDGSSDQSSEDHSTSESEENAPAVHDQPPRVAGGRRQPSGNVSRTTQRRLSLRERESGHDYPSSCDQQPCPTGRRFPRVWKGFPWSTTVIINTHCGDAIAIRELDL